MLASLRSGLARDWGKACQACGLLSAQAAQLGHSLTGSDLRANHERDDQHRKGGYLRNAGDADENGGLFGENFVS